MLRKRPLVSRSYLGCPLRYLKTVLILPWIYCILDKADGLHHQTKEWRQAAEPA